MILIANACNNIVAFGKILHGVKNPLHASAYIDRTLIEEHLFTLRNDGKNVLDVTVGIRTFRITHGDISYNPHLKSIALLVKVGERLTDRYRGGVMGVADAGKYLVFNLAPDRLDERSSYQFWDLREYLMGVEEQRLAAQAGCQPAGGKSVGVVGIEGIGTGKKQSKEETEVVFGIKKRLLAEQESHSDSLVGSVQRGATRKSSTDKGYIVTLVMQSRTGAHHPLVCDKVVGY